MNKKLIRLAILFEKDMKCTILLQQTLDSYSWTNKLLDSISYEKWEQTPPVLETNVLWQTGHLLVSFYYNSILVIKGHQNDVMNSMPLGLYSELFTQAAPIESVGKVIPSKLYNDMKLLQAKSLELIAAMGDEELEKNLELSRYPHPIAKTKFDALDWNIKHTFWHCGQLGLLKRVVDRRSDFGLNLNIKR